MNTSIALTDSETNNAKEVRYEVTKGKLPEGVTFNAGKLTGTPLASGKFDFTVKVTIDGWIEKELKYTLNVATAFTLAKTTVNENEDYSCKVATELVTEDAGYKNIKYTIVDGKLPEGLSIAADGTISGKATKAGKYSFTVNCYAEQGSGWRVSRYNYKETFTIEVKGTGEEAKDDTASKIAALEKEIADLKAKLGNAGSKDEAKALEEKIAALETTVSELKNQKSSGGCGGSVIASASAIAAVTLLGLGLALKKKKEEK